jgi:DNA polymerase-1
MAQENKKRLVLLDAHAIIHRAYHALPDFSSSKGEPTGALYGVVTMLIKIINDLNPDQIAACYDVPSPTHRHDAYDAYKATRKKIDDGLIAQLIRSKDIFHALNIPIYEAKGFEADDVLGTIVEKLKEKNGREIVIASGDMDTLQLVSGKKVQAYTLRKGINDTMIYDEEAVKTRFGFGPELLPDYKGLRGDPSDNIIGVPGIGEKTATELIQKFGSIEDIYERIKKDEAGMIGGAIKARTIELLKTHEEEARFSKMLATIRRDAPVEYVDPEHTWREVLDVEKVRALFNELEFKTLLDRLKDAVAGKVKVAASSAAKKVGTADESDPESSTEGAKKPKKPAKIEKTPIETDISQEEIDQVALALWVIDSNISTPGMTEILEYAETDSFVVAKEKILGKLAGQKNGEVYEKIELPLRPVIKKMEEKGVKIDVAYLKELSTEYHKELDKLQAKIWEYAGEEFNVNSPKQLGEILFGKILAQTKGKVTATGNRSTKESELEKVRDAHPIVPLLLQYRELQKLLSTYIDSIPEKVAGGGRLHASFLQTGAVTGRLSSQDPNLQNIPIKSELGKRIRNAFIAEEGSVLAAFDYSQIELRIAAFMSGEEKLIEIFKSGGDVHTGVASFVFKVPPEKVDAEMRRRAKVINFGILYGMGVNALKANLGTSKDEAKQFHEEYFKNFSTLANFLEKTKYEAAKTGYTETFFGRRRFFPGLHSKLPFIRAASERMAINAPLQGTSADLIKLAMIKVNDLLEKENLTDKVFLILTVHDELVYEIEEDVVPKIRGKIIEVMEGLIPLSETAGVPLVVSSSVGKNWGEMKK